MTHAWNRQPDELDGAWHAFETYRGLGPTRQMGAVCPLINRSRSTVLRYSKRWDWYRRAALWDAATAQAEDTVELDERAKLRREHVRRLAIVNTLALEVLEAAVVADTLSPTNAVRLFLESIKLERLVTGESTDTVEVTEKRDLSKVLTVDQIAQLRRIKQQLSD